MTSLIIDIRQTVVRAVITQDGVPGYHRTFVHAGADSEELGLQSSDALSLPDILKTVRAEFGRPIDSAALILPPEEVVLSRHKTPKVSSSDAEKIIGRKIATEAKEDFPPFYIVPGVSDQKTETWHALYVPTATINQYRKLFRTSRLKLKHITTPVNAMLDAFKSVREAMFNAHAVFEVSTDFVEAYYLSSEGILHTERLQYTNREKHSESADSDPEKIVKQLVFKIINTIFRINSHYQNENPQIPVQLAWICGGVTGVDEVAAALKDAMSVEVAFAPAIPSGMDDEIGYVPLVAYAASLQAGTAVLYTTADIFKRFPLQKTYGIAIYGVTAAIALLAVMLTERQYQSLRKQVAPPPLVAGKNKSASSAPNYLKNLETLKKLTSQQFLFYPLFRELANDLPDGILLENLDYKFKDNKGLLVITAMAPLSAKGGGAELPGRLMAFFDHSSYLQNHKEPFISTVVKDKDRFLKIVFTCEVKPFDTTK